MTGRPGLVALQCLRCSTPVPAEADEVAWVCQNCGQGLLLDEVDGLKPITVHSAAAAGTTKSWKPFWVALGRVRFSRRESFGRDAAPEPRWSQPVRFVLPAYATGVERAVALGVGLLRRPPALEEGEAQVLQGATVLPEQLAALTRFVVLSIEAERNDKLEAIEFTVELDTPELWVLPTEET
ncbi:MAG TPA: hypothetical protein VI701_00045 [Anaerolineales bacterium]|nr:hypothetical protein [Anaerolineales bacterium]